MRYNIFAHLARYIGYLLAIASKGLLLYGVFDMRGDSFVCTRGNLGLLFVDAFVLLAQLELNLVKRLLRRFGVLKECP